MHIWQALVCAKYAYVAGPRLSQICIEQTMYIDGYMGCKEGGPCKPEHLHMWPTWLHWVMRVMCRLRYNAPHITFEG